MRQRRYRWGAVHWVDLSMSRGGEVAKVRPAVIVSNDTANRFLNRVQVVPLTSNTRRVYPGEALVRLQGTERKAMADQIATASTERLGDHLGHPEASDMRRVEEAIRRQLGLGEG